MSGGRKKGHGGGGGHGGAWVVTFADLVSLLMAFFVMIVSFSVQDTEAVHQASGSIRDAFGVQPMQRPAGMIEKDGVPVRETARAVGIIDPTDDVEFAAERNDDRDLQGPEANTHDFQIASQELPRQFLSAAQALRQALADLPDVAELSRDVQFEETEEGLNIRIVDQDGRSMFSENSAAPSPALLRLLGAMAPVLANLPNKVRITGHTSAAGSERAVSIDAWTLSAARAISAAERLAATGFDPSHLDSVSGRGDAEPLFPNDPFLSANRRIEILLVAEAPVLPETMSR